MKVAIIYLPQHQKLENAARSLGRALEQGGHRVEYFPINTEERSKSFRNYDFIYLGSVSEGTLGGKIPAKVSEFVRQARGLDHSQSGAFLMKRPVGFNNKGLKRLMEVLESAGSLVQDFQLVGSNADLEILAKRLKR
jgi:flavorubredoxin